MASNMTDFYETWNLSLLSSNEHIKNVIKDPSPSQEPPRPPKLQQSVIILHEGSWWLQTWWIFMKLDINSTQQNSNGQNQLDQTQLSQTKLSQTQHDQTQPGQTQHGQTQLDWTQLGQNQLVHRKKKQSSILQYNKNRSTKQNPKANPSKAELVHLLKTEMFYSIIFRHPYYSHALQNNILISLIVYC